MTHLLQESPSDAPGVRDLSKLSVNAFLDAAVQDVPDQPFLIFGQTELTYAQFQQRTMMAARAWQALGVSKDDRVAFMVENRPEFLYAWLGLARLGAVLVAINTGWQTGEVQGFLELTNPKIALVSGHLDVFEVAASKVGSLKVVQLGSDATSAGPSRSASFANDTWSTLVVRTQNNKLTVPAIESDDVVSFISTSGTTGNPKAVMQTHGNYVLTGEGYAHWLSLRPAERLYLCLPLFHINSQAYTVMGAIAARGTLVLVERFSASRFWPDLARYQVNVFNYIGSMMAVLMKSEPIPAERELLPG